MPCQVYDGKCVLLNSFRSPDLYFDFLKKCSVLYLQTGKFESLGMHALMHLSSPVLPIFCCWLPIYQSFNEVCKNNICQYFLFVYTSSSNVNVYHNIYNESFTMKLCKQYPFTPSKLKYKYISTLKYCEYVRHNSVLCKSVPRTILYISTVTNREKTLIFRV